MAHQEYIGSASSVPLDRDTIVVSGWHSVKRHITRTETGKSSVLSSVHTAVRKRGSLPGVQSSACSEHVDGDTECDTDVRLAQTVASSIPPPGNKLLTSKQPQSENMAYSQSNTQRQKTYMSRSRALNRQTFIDVENGEWTGRLRHVLKRTLA